MSVWIAARSAASGRGGRPRRRGAVLCRDERCGRETPRAAAIALTGRPRPRGHARGQLFGGGHALDRFAQDLVLERLLAEQPLQLADLLVSGAQLRGRHHLLAGASRRQRALRHQPTPGEELVGGNAMMAGYERDRVAGQIRLFDDLHLLLCGPAAPPLHRRDHLNALGAWRAFVETSHRVRYTTHTYPSARS